MTCSFYWYGQKTEGLVIGQKTEAARVLVNPIVLKEHLKKSGLRLKALKNADSLG